MKTSEWPRAEPLMTSRLDLEPLRVDHAAEMAAVLDEPALFTYTGGTPPTEADLRARYLRQAAGVSPDGREGWLNWVLRLRATRIPIGTVQATLSSSGTRSARRTGLGGRDSVAGCWLCHRGRERRRRLAARIRSSVIRGTRSSFPRGLGSSGEPPRAHRHTTRRRRRDSLDLGDEQTMTPQRALAHGRAQSERRG